VERLSEVKKLQKKSAASTEVKILPQNLPFGTEKIVKNLSEVCQSPGLGLNSEPS
jgi:hypothetical protein